MNTQGFLTKDQCGLLHKSALRVLAEHGVSVEHQAITEKLAALGAQIDGTRVRFPAALVEREIGSAEKEPPDLSHPHVSASVGIYQCQFLDPVTNELQTFDETTLEDYVGFARSLGIDYISLLGLPFTPRGIARNPQPLLEKLYAWKLGIHSEGTVQMTEYCAPLMEMFQCHAAYSGEALEDVFRAYGYMISPLRLTRGECEQILFFARHGLEMGIGTMATIGGSSPVSAEGTVVQLLAEHIFLFFLHKALFGHNRFQLGLGCCSMDMRNGYPCYGRPEQYRVTLAMADLARFYGCGCSAHAGLTDAKLPSVESGVQKMMGILLSALALGRVAVEAGLMSMDEVCSPVQMVMDVDMADALNSLLAPAQFDERACAVDEIIAAGPGGNHMGTDFTAERCRAAFLPRTWSSGLLSHWMSSGKQTDADAARDLWQTWRSTSEATPMISEEEERDLMRIIRADV